MTSVSHSSGRSPLSSSARPVQKVRAAGIVGAFVTVVVMTLNIYVLPEQKKIPGELSAAMTTLLTFASAYIVPPGKDEVRVPEDA